MTTLAIEPHKIQYQEPPPPSVEVDQNIVSDQSASVEHTTTEFIPSSTIDATVLNFRAPTPNSFLDPSAGDIETIAAPGRVLPRPQRVDLSGLPPSTFHGDEFILK